MAQTDQRTFIRLVPRSALWHERGIVRGVLHMMRPDLERAPSRTASYEIMPTYAQITPSVVRRLLFGSDVPRVLDDEPEAVLNHERDRGLHVRDRARVDANDGHPALPTRPAHARIQITRLERAVLKHKWLPVGHLERAGLGCAPAAIVPVHRDLGAVPGRVRGGVALPCRWAGVHEGLGEVGCECRKGVRGGPAWLVACAEATRRGGHVCTRQHPEEGHREERHPNHACVTPRRERTQGSETMDTLYTVSPALHPETRKEPDARRAPLHRVVLCVVQTDHHERRRALSSDGPIEWTLRVRGDTTQCCGAALSLPSSDITSTR